MAIIVFCGSDSRDTKITVLLEMIGEDKQVVVHRGRYRDICSQVQKSIKKINIVSANLLKSERYELYLIAKRYGKPYCVISVSTAQDLERASPKNRYDNPYIEWSCITQDWICCILQADVAKSEAHRSLIVDAQYLSEVKNIIQRINQKHGNLFFFGEIERKVLRLLQCNPASPSEVERSYEQLILKEIQARR